MTLTASILTALNADEQASLKSILGEIAQKHPTISRVMLYGSKARGDFVEDSDIDLLIISTVPLTRVEKQDIMDAIYEREVDNGVVISAVFVTEKAFRGKVNVFLSVARREGIELWSRG